MITKKMRLKKYNLSENQLAILDKIEYNEEQEAVLKRMITRYLKDGLCIETLSQNFHKILELGKDSSSLKSNIIRYGEIDGLKKFEDKCKQTTFTRDDYIQKYGLDVAEKKLKSRGASLENYINRYGEKIGNKKWLEYCKKRAYTYKKNRGTGKYASRNLEWFQKQYGDEQGYEVWDTKRKTQAYKVSKEYYIDTYGETEGLIRLRKTKSRDLSFFINKYGQDEGFKRYSNMLLKKVNALKKRKTYSSWSLECCLYIKKVVDDLIFYGERELVWNLPLEWQIKLNQKIVSPDLFYRGKIIEFQGDLFHGNRNLFEGNEKPHPFNNLTVDELRKQDNIRLDYYKSKNYKVLEIWENDYKEDKERTIKKCLMFLK